MYQVSFDLLYPKRYRHLVGNISQLLIMQKKILIQLLLPLARRWNKRSLLLPEIVEALKQALIIAAREELEARQERVTAARIHALSGVHRKDISRFESATVPDSYLKDPSVRAVTVWTTDKLFLMENGTPKILDFSGKESSFHILASRVSSDVNAHALAFAMEKSGLIVHTKTGLKLVRQVPVFPASERIYDRILIEEIQDLAACLAHNQTSSSDQRFLQLKTAFDKIPAKYAPRINTWLSKQGSKFQQRMNRYLAKFDCDTNQKIPKTKDTVRVGISTFTIIDDQGSKNES